MRIDWDDARKKGWHLLLMLASAYLAANPQYAWAIPAVTGAAGISAPPAIGAAKALPTIAVGAGLGLLLRLA